MTTAGILNDLDVHPRIVSAAKKAGYQNSWAILGSSLGEVKTKTGLSGSDAQRLVTAAAQQCTPPFKTAWRMLEEETSAPRKHIPIGCATLDAILGGGIPCSGLTEIAGESGSGKTQMALQLALQCQLPPALGGCAKGVAYICTESQFPMSRLEQMISRRKGQHTYNGKQFSDNIYVHHLPDMDNLVDCVRYQLPHFVGQRGIGLVIIDSVAAVFRAAEERQETKSRMAQQLGFRLRQMATSRGVAVVAINQVTSSIGRSIDGMVEDNAVPALGLAWANLVTTRLMVRKTAFRVPLCEDATPFSSRDGRGGRGDVTDAGVRTMEVIFCPWLARTCSPFTVTQDGVRDVDPAGMSLPFT